MSDRSMTRAQVRAVDRLAIDRFGVPGIVLMENAGRGTAELLLELGASGPVVICCGKGNNGGDGFVIARHLQNHGCEVRVLLCAEPAKLTGDAAVNFRILQMSGTPCDVIDAAVSSFNDHLAETLAGAEWIVDALLGTGINGEVREPFAAIIARINASGLRVLAVDLPSGLDCDTGLPLGICVRAVHTATFVARKQGFDNPDSEQWTGEVRVIDIGVPRAVLETIALNRTGGEATDEEAH